jgi:FAD/FMN-containing dehydrogenase
MITNVLLSSLRQTVSDESVITDEDSLLLYGTDRSGTIARPGVVVLPRSEPEVASVVRLLTDAEIPITVRGAGTGVTGGAVPVEGGAVVALARLNETIELDKASGVVIAPAGSRLVDVERVASRHGYRFGSPLGDLGTGTVGGALARNGDGLGGITGVLHSQVRGIRAVLADGGCIEAEVNGSHGQSLDGTGILIGSEGGLCVFTSAQFSLTRRLPARRIVVASFEDPIVAAEAGAGLLSAGAEPAVADVFDSATWTRTAEWPANEGSDGLLLVYVVGLEADIDDETAWILGVCTDYLAQRATVVDEDRCPQIIADWNRVIRANEIQPYRLPVDLAVPIHDVPDLLESLYGKARQQNVPVAGVTRMITGAVHMHVPLIPREDESHIRAAHFMEEMAEIAHDLQGVSMAIHGVGTRRIDLVEVTHQQSELEVLRSIRQIYTPTDAFSVPFVPPPPKERRNFKERQARDGQIAKVREVLSQQIQQSAEVNEAIQIEVSSTHVLGQTLRTAGEFRLPVAIHDQPSKRPVDISLAEMDRIVMFDADSRIIAVDGGTTLGSMLETAREQGLWLPVSPLIDRSTTVCDYLAWYRADSRSLGWGTTNSRVVGIEAVCGRGDIISWGGLVRMQHAGPRLSELCIGVRHRYAVINAVAFELVTEPSARAVVSARFSTLDHARAAVDRWLGTDDTSEALKCRPTALCITLDAHLDDESAMHRHEIHAFVEFAGKLSSVERQARWARHIADASKAIDLKEFADGASDEAWALAQTHYRQWPGDMGDRVLHLVIWCGMGEWSELVRKLRQAVKVHVYNCRLLVDLGAGRIDMLVDDGAIAPDPLVRTLCEIVARSRCMLEVWSSPLAGKWHGTISPTLERVRDDLKVNFDPCGVLPDGWDRKIVWNA